MSALYVVSFVTIVVSLILYNSRQPLSRGGSSTTESSNSTEDIETSPLTGRRGTWFSQVAQS